MSFFRQNAFSELRHLFNFETFLFSSALIMQYSRVYSASIQYVKLFPLSNSVVCSEKTRPSLSARYSLGEEIWFKCCCLSRPIISPFSSLKTHGSTIRKSVTRPFLLRYVQSGYTMPVRILHRQIIVPLIPSRRLPPSFLPLIHMPDQPWKGRTIYGLNCDRADGKKCGATNQPRCLREIGSGRLPGSGRRPRSGAFN